MKKTLIVFFVAISIALSACGSNNSDTVVESADIESSVDGKHVSLVEKEPVLTTDNQANFVEENNTIPFSSVDEMLRTFTSTQNPTTGIVNRNSNEMTALTGIAEKNGMRLPIPAYSNGALPLRNTSHLDNILVESNSVYDIPLIWYYAELDGSDVIISAGVLPDETVERIGDGGIEKLKEVHKEILAALPDGSSADKVSATTTPSNVVINSGVVPAIITQYSTDPRYHVEFITEDAIYVKIYVYPEDYDRGVLSELSFGVESIK